MKKFLAILFLTVTFAAVAGANPPCLPTPACYPCTGSSN